jgi:hypothetical protein
VGSPTELAPEDQAAIQPPEGSGGDSAVARPRARPKGLDLAGHTVEQNLWILAGPLMAERLLQSIVDAADMAMVGRVGAASVAAVGLSNQISMIATSVFDIVLTSRATSPLRTWFRDRLSRTGRPSERCCGSVCRPPGRD